MGRITLDAPFLQRDSLVLKVSDGLYQLPAGYGDTKAIFVGVDSANIVRFLMFSYVDGKDFETARQDYANTLGPPTDAEGWDATGAHVIRASWQDERTAFDLVWRACPDSLPAVYSFLRNR